MNGEQYIRIAVRNDGDNERLISVLIEEHSMEDRFNE